MFANGKTKQHMRKVSIGSDFLFECFLHGLFFGRPKGSCQMIWEGCKVDLNLLGLDGPSETDRTRRGPQGPLRAHSGPAGKSIIFHVWSLGI